MRKFYLFLFLIITTSSHASCHTELMPFIQTYWKDNRLYGDANWVPIDICDNHRR